MAVPEVSGRVVTTPDGRVLRRVGSDNRPLRGDFLARFVMERISGSAEEEPLASVSPDDFDLEMVNEALAHRERPGVDRDGLVQALIDLGEPVKLSVCE